LAFHSNYFIAVSAGAALCNWLNYRNGSDNYNDYPLTESPEDNPELYIKTAPISGIKTANTPIIFQHGELDTRVPLTSVFEMFRALKRKNVQTELFVFPGKEHGWNDQKESCALMMQNYSWFCHHLLGEKLDFYPMEEVY
jgi:dipeptidyl aminopeptidase/acylaminoacyl peptidase